MIEWIIALGALAVFFFIVACALVSRCNYLYDEIEKLEASNFDLKCSVKVLRTENNRLRSQECAIPDTRRVTALNLTIRLKDEQIDDLKTKLKRQQQLLQQKWEGSKK